MPTQLIEEIERAFIRAGFRERKDIAAALGISPQYISGLMMGHRRFTPRLLAYVIHTLGISKAQAKRWHRTCAVADGWKI